MATSSLTPRAEPPSSRLWDRLPGGVWRYYAGFAVGRISGLIVIPIAARVLGTAGFGRFEAAFALFQAATIVLDAGLGAALVRFVGELEYDTDGLLRAAAGIQVFASLGAIVILGVPLLLFDMPDHRVALVVIALVIYGYNEGFAVIGGGLLRATGRDGAYAVCSVVRLILTAGAGAAGALLLGASGTLLGVAFGGTGFTFYALYKLAHTHRSTSRVTRTVMMTYGLPLISTSVMSWTLSVSDRLFLRGDVSATTLGRYSANYRLGNLILIFVAGPLGLTWISAARRAASKGELDWARQAWAVRFSAVAILGSLMILAASPVLVKVIFGSGFKLDRTVIAAVCISGWCGGLYYLFATPILLAQDTRSLVIVALGGAAFNLTTEAILIPRFGAHGAAIATVSSYAFVCIAAAVVAGLRAQRWAYSPKVTLAVLLGAGAVIVAATAELPALCVTVVALAAAAVSLILYRRRSTMATL